MSNLLVAFNFVSFLPNSSVVQIPSAIFVSYILSYVCYILVLLVLISSFGLNIPSQILSILAIFCLFGLTCPTNGSELVKCVNTGPLVIYVLIRTDSALGDKWLAVKYILSKWF